MAPGVNALLRQAKAYESLLDGSYRFGVRSEVMRVPESDASTPAPATLDAPFVVTQATPGSAYPETYVRLATAQELQTASLLVPNLLRYFRDASVTPTWPSVSNPGDYLRLKFASVVTPPPMWPLQAAGSAYYVDLPIASVAADKRLVLAQSGWYPVGPTVAWEWRNGTGSVLFSGVAGTLERETAPVAGQLYLVDRALTVHDTPTQALTSMAATQAQFESLAKSLAYNPQSFLSEGGNPVDTAYTY
jgi:hypothetical protein